MKLLTVFCMVFVMVTQGHWVVAQISDLSDVEGARQRLEKYLVDADDAMGPRGCLVFRISKVVTAADSTSDVSELSETIGLQFYDRAKKIYYSSNHSSKVGAALPNRTEMFRINGKEKGKIYGVGHENANGQVIEIEPDKEGKRAGWNNSTLLSGMAHIELDPFALPILNSMALEGRLSSVDGAIKMWLTVFDLVSEQGFGKKLSSRWVSKRKDLANELLFDEAQGGMPVATREYTIDAKGKQTKAYLSETKTVWRKLKSDDDDRWVPERLESIYSDKSDHMNYIVELDWIELKKLDEWVSEVNWKTLFETKDTNWYRNISRMLLEKHIEEKRKAIVSK